MASFVDRIEALELKVKALEALREGIEYLGATVAGQTEALDVVTEELNKLNPGFGQGVIANHNARQAQRKKQMIENSKANLQQMVDSGALVAQEVAGPGTVLVGQVTKDGAVVQEFELGFFENFPKELQEAVGTKGPGATYDGPKGIFELKQVFAFNKKPAVVENLIDQAEGAPAPTTPEAPVASPQ